MVEKTCLFFALLAIGCRSPELQELPAKGEEGVFVVVETPAGSVEVIRYDPATQGFAADSGKVAFLPFPGNWGFVPSTHIPYSKGQSFAPVETLILGKRLESGALVEVRLVAAVILSEKGRRSLLTLATPVDTALCNMDIRDFPDLAIGYPGVKSGLEQWLRQRKGAHPVEVLDWKDGQFALRFLEASLPKKK